MLVTMKIPPPLLLPQVSLCVLLILFASSLFCRFLRILKCFLWTLQVRDAWGLIFLLEMHYII